MKKIIVLKHQSEMKYSKEFFLLEIPKELSYIIYSIFCLCLVVFSIIFLGKIDEVVKTSGIVRTKYNVSEVQNVIGGKIIELDYKHGQKVKKGDVLYKIDATSYNAQRNNYIVEKKDISTKIEGLELLIKSFYSEKNLCKKSDLLSYTRFESYLQNLYTLEIQKKIASKQYELENDKPSTMKNAYNTALKKEELNLSSLNISCYKADFIANLIDELNSKKIQLYECEQSIKRLDNEYMFLEVKSPMDGYVQELSSLNIGDYLEANATVLNIVPNDNQNFRVEIQILAKDIGKIDLGQKVKYRLRAFPFYEYDGAEGTISAIAPDIRTSDNGELFYSAYADINRIEFSNRHGDSFPIKAGLETDIRIVLKRKNIIYFILKKMDFLN